MKRAILVTTGTLAGLVSALSYSPGTATSLAAVPTGSAAGLGAPPAAVSSDPTTAAPRRSVATPRKPVAHAKAAASRPAVVATAAAGAPAAVTSPPAVPVIPPPAAVVASLPPKVTKVVPPVVKPKPPVVVPTKAPVVVSTPKDVMGAPVTYKYGTLQVAIRVLNGKVLDAWAVSYPQGPSLPYSEMAIPILRSQSVNAQSSHIAGATGASLTSGAWISSLASALSTAGL
jgi:uncharacterized protein with FMN-binding domain